MKRAPCLEKGIGAFLFRVVLKLKFIEISVYRQPSIPPRIHFMLGFAGRTERARRITRSGSVPVSMPKLLPRWPACAGIWVERDLFQVMPDPQPHTCPTVSHRRARGTNGGGRCHGQVVACELLAGQPTLVDSGRRAER